MVKVNKNRSHRTHIRVQRARAIWVVTRKLVLTAICIELKKLLYTTGKSYVLDPPQTHNVQWCTAAFVAQATAMNSKTANGAGCVCGCGPAVSVNDSMEETVHVRSIITEINMEYMQHEHRNVACEDWSFPSSGSSDGDSCTLKRVKGQANKLMAQRQA